jgi:hypothetical protein
MGTPVLKALVLVSTGVLWVTLASCGTDAQGVSICRQIQEARCQRAPVCGISITPPYTTTGSSVDACIRASDIACLHGLENDNGPMDVDGCVQAIKTHCSAVKTPESDPHCSWLVPPAMAAPADVSDGPAEGNEDASDAAAE